MSTNPPPYDEKVAILHRNGFIRDQDRENHERVERRWALYQQVPQKTIRSIRQPKSEREGDDV
jgi:hypothetical protein